MIKILLVNIIYEEGKTSSYNYLKGADFILLEFDLDNSIIKEMKTFNYVLDNVIINDNINRKIISIEEFLLLYKGLSNSCKLIVMNNHLKTLKYLKELYKVYNIKPLLIKNIKILDIKGLYKKEIVNRVTLDLILEYLKLKKEKIIIDDILNITLLTLVKKKEDILNYINGTLRL